MEAEKKMNILYEGGKMKCEDQTRPGEDGRVLPITSIIHKQGETRITEVMYIRYLP